MDEGSSSVGDTATVCHLECEISSVKVTGIICTGGGGALFLRCHVPAGGGRTIQIDSHGAEADETRVDDGGTRLSPASWRNVASLRCDGSPACVRELVDRRSVVFEVRRRRRRTAILGRAVGSELVARAEVAWRDVVAAAAGDGGAAVDAAVMERVALAPAAATSRGSVSAATVVQDDASAPAVMSVRMSVRVSAETAVPATAGSVRTGAEQEAISTGCEWSAGAEDVFAVAACIADDAFE